MDRNTRADLLAALKSDHGATDVATKNGEILRRLHGRPVAVDLYYGGNPPEYSVLVAFESGATWRFTGFSWGYGGKGCRGLAEWCEANDVPLYRSVLGRLNNTEPSGIPVWSWVDSGFMRAQIRDLLAKGDGHDDDEGDGDDS